MQIQKHVTNTGVGIVRADPRDPFLSTRSQSVAIRAIRSYPRCIRARFLNPITSSEPFFPIQSQKSVSIQSRPRKSNRTSEDIQSYKWRREPTVSRQCNVNVFFKYCDELTFYQKGPKVRPI